MADNVGSVKLDVDLEVDSSQVDKDFKKVLDTFKGGSDSVGDAMKRVEDRFSNTKNKLLFNLKDLGNAMIDFANDAGTSGAFSANLSHVTAASKGVIGALREIASAKLEAFKEDAHPDFNAQLSESSEILRSMLTLLGKAKDATIGKSVLFGGANAEFEADMRAFDEWAYKYEKVEETAEEPIEFETKGFTGFVNNIVGGINTVADAFANSELLGSFTTGFYKLVDILKQPIKPKIEEDDVENASTLVQDLYDRYVSLREVQAKSLVSDSAELTSHREELAEVESLKGSYEELLQVIEETKRNRALQQSFADKGDFENAEMAASQVERLTKKMADLQSKFMKFGIDAVQGAAFGDDIPAKVDAVYNQIEQSYLDFQNRLASEVEPTMSPLMTLNAQLAEAKSVLSSMESGKVPFSSEDFIKASTNVKILTSQIDRLKATMKQQVELAITNQIEDLESKLPGLESQLQEALSAENVDNDKVAQIESEISRTKESIATLNGALGSVDTASDESNESITSMLGNLSRITPVAGGAAQKIVGMVSSLSSVAEAHPVILAVSVAIEAIYKACTLVASVASKMGNALKAGLSKIISLAKSVVNAFKKVATTIKNAFSKSEKSVGGFFKKLLMVGLGVRGIMALVRRMRTQIIQAFKDLASQTEDFGREMGEAQTAINQVKGSVAVAFQPVVSALIPTFVSLAGVINDACNALARFFAILTGQGYVYRYSAATQDLADNLKGAGGAAKKATKDLMGFDEINRLSDPNQGGGGGGADTAGTFEKLPIEDVESELARLVREAWEVSDFTEVGRRIGSTLIKGMQSVDWDKITSIAGNLGKDLATFLNGLFSVENGQNIFQATADMVAGGINTITNFLYNFVANFDFKTFGTNLASGINELFESIQWNKIANTIRMGTMGIRNAIISFIDKLNFEEIFTDVETVLNGIGDGIGNLLEGIGYAIQGFVDAGGIERLGTWIANGISGMSDYINEHSDDISNVLSNIIIQLSNSVSNVGSELLGLGTSIINALIASFSEAVTNGDFVKNMQDLTTALSEALQGINWTELISSLSVILPQLVEGLNLILEEIPWDDIMTTIQTALEGLNLEPLVGALARIFSTIVAELAPHLLKAGNAIISGLLNGLGSFGRVLDFMRRSFLGLLNLILGLLGIHSPSTVFAEIGENIVLGLVNGLSDLKDRVVEIFSNLWDGIKGIINTILGGVETMANGIISGINGGINAFNSLSFEVPDWVPEIGGNSVGFSIPTIPTVSIPRLAQGGVIPPNREFLAMLGDQTSGTNIEAPLDTIKQAVAEEMAEYIQAMMTGFQAVVSAIDEKDMDVVIGDKAIGEATQRYNRRQSIVTGR